MISGAVALLASCSNDFLENGDINSDKQLKTVSDIVLQERNKKPYIIKITNIL